MASFIGIHPANSQRMADASAQLMYQKDMGSAYSRMQHNWEAATVSRRAKHTQELDSRLEQVPAAMEKHLATCTPADLLVYMESHWLPNHAGTMLPDWEHDCLPQWGQWVPAVLVDSCHTCPLTSCSLAEFMIGIPQTAPAICRVH